MKEFEGSPDLENSFRNFSLQLMPPQFPLATLMLLLILLYY